MKKGSKALIIVLVLIIIALISALVYVIYFDTKKIEKKDTKPETKVDVSKEETNNESEEINNIIGFDSSKIVGEKSSDRGYANRKSMDGITVEHDEKNNSLEMTFTYDTVFGLNVKDYSVELTGFSKKIVDIDLGAIGQGVEGTILLVFFEDGTVKYMPVYKCIEKWNFEFYDIKELSNITKFYDVATRYYVTILVQDINGNLYDVADFLPEDWDS